MSIHTKLFFMGISTLLLSTLTYAEMRTIDVNGYEVEYYIPNVAKIKSSSTMPMSELRVLIEDPSPLPENYRPPKPNRLLVKGALIKTTATTFSIDYIAAGGQDLWGEACYEFPEEAKVNFEAAAAIWANNIDTDVPVTIQACWANFAGNTLGYSGGYVQANFSNAPVANTYYKPALANSFAGSDLSANYDMYITYNGAYTWYYGTDGNTPADKMDLLSVVLHEVGHGLNFSGGMSYDSGTGLGSYSNYPNIYDRMIIDGSGDALLDLPNNSTEMGDALISDNLFFSGVNANAANGNNPVKIYAPTTWVGGSSFSHLDYNTFNNTDNQLMVYAISKGEAVHNPGDVTLGMFQDMGWKVASEPTPSVNPAVIMYLLN